MLDPESKTKMLACLVLTLLYIYMYIKKMSIKDQIEYCDHITIYVVSINERPNCGGVN